MTDDEDDDDDVDNEVDPDEPDESSEDAEEVESADRPGLPIDPKLLGSIQAFHDMQRTIASFDFGFMPAIQAAAASAAANFEGIRQSLQDYVAQSIDFVEISGLAAQTFDVSTNASELIEGISRSLDLSALEQARQAIIASYQPPLIDETVLRSATAIAAEFQDVIARMGSLGHLLEGLDRWIPENIRPLDIDVVARIALEEGIPLAWIPRTSLAEKLIAAPDAQSRMGILDEHKEDVLDDCVTALVAVRHAWARECEESIQTFRSGFVGPAQSHAGNIVDSIVMLLFGERDVKVAEAKEDFDDVLLQVIGEAITIRPLVRTFVRWWPKDKVPPPDYFARHATAHAVGYPGLFNDLNALIAIMLATSLTVQYWQDPGAAVGLEPDPEADGS